MTVIAFDGRVVAADTGMYDGVRLMGATSRKIIALGNLDTTVVLASSGCVSGGLEFLRWFVERDLDRATVPPCHGGVTGAIFRYKRPVEGYELGNNQNSPEPYVEEAPYAFGSGGPHARGFMDAQANAIAAAESACKWIHGCEPPVEAFDLRAGEWLTKMERPSDLHIIERIVYQSKWRLL